MKNVRSIFPLPYFSIVHDMISWFSFWELYCRLHDGQELFSFFNIDVSHVVCYGVRMNYGNIPVRKNAAEIISRERFSFTSLVVLYCHWLDEQRNIPRAERIHSVWKGELHWRQNKSFVRRGILEESFYNRGYYWLSDYGVEVCRELFR